MELRWGAATDTGLVRPANEDAVLAEDGLYAVADGMGGHAAGEVASSIALATLHEHLGNTGVDSARLTDAIRAANDAVHQRAVDQPRLRGMGTTLTVIAVANAEGGLLRFLLANVGDSRAYLYTEGGLRQLTRDHSYVAELVAAGEISAEEALVHPHRHVVTRALGVEPLVAVDTWLVSPESGDRYLLCSDGLTNEIDDEAIAALLARHADPQEAADRLIVAANANGGRDNTTVVVLDVIGAAATDPTPIEGRVVEQELGGWLPVGIEEEFASNATIEVPLTDPSATRTTEQLVAPAPVEAPRKRRRLTLPTVIFLALVLAVLVAAFVIVAAYGRSGFYAGFDDDDTVAIFQGRPGGVLWFEPTVEERYELTRDELQPDVVDRIAANPRYSSSAGAARFLDQIADNPDNLLPVVTVPPTTTARTARSTPSTTATAERTP
jgi:serine/threonine protein phosphatase PrpC